MNHLFDDVLQTVQEPDPKSQPYTTVRALFPEGSELYPGAGFQDKTHIQICVESGAVLGVFRIPEWQRRNSNCRACTSDPEGIL